MNRLLRPLHDLRFQIEGCLTANSSFDQDKNIPFASTVCFVLLGLVQSQIRNLQSIIVLPGVLGCQPLRRTVQVRLGTNPAVRLPDGPPASPCSHGGQARPSSSRSLSSAQAPPHWVGSPVTRSRNFDS